MFLLQDQYFNFKLLLSLQSLLPRLVQADYFLLPISFIHSFPTNSVRCKLQSSSAFRLFDEFRLYPFECETLKIKKFEQQYTYLPNFFHFVQFVGFHSFTIFMMPACEDIFDEDNEGDDDIFEALLVIMWIFFYWTLLLLVSNFLFLLAIFKVSNRFRWPSYRRRETTSYQPFSYYKNQQRM